MVLRCCVIGLGMGRNHAKAYHEHPDCRLAAVCDIDPKRLKQATGDFACTGYADWREMLKREKPDILSVATPNHLHAEMAIGGFKAGCHVLCEKPMALNARQGEAMLRAAKQARRRLMINFSYRFTPAAYALKVQVDAGVLGKVYAGRSVWHRRRGIPGFGGWFGQKKLSGGGPLIDLGVHRLDLALWLMGHPQPQWVMANTFAPIATRLAKASRKAYDCEDAAFAMIRFQDGAMLNLEASWALNTRENEFMETRLYGTDGGLAHFNVSEGNGFFGYTFDGECFVEKQGVQYNIRAQAPIPQVRSAYAHFAECVRDGTEPIATGEQGLTVMRLLDAVYASAAKGAPVRLG